MEGLENTGKKLWDAVKETDPRYTKKVEFGRKYTAVDPMYNIQRMTEQFGPVGDGWVYNAKHSTLPVGDGILAVCDVCVGINENMMFGSVRGTHMLYTPAGFRGEKNNEPNPRVQEVDDDAPKKAMTDALSKALSHLGFSADVYLGQYDDNKYVAEKQQDSKIQATREQEARTLARMKSNLDIKSDEDFFAVMNWAGVDPDMATDGEIVDAVKAKIANEKVEWKRVVATALKEATDAE